MLTTRKRRVTGHTTAQLGTACGERQRRRVAAEGTHRRRPGGHDVREDLHVRQQLEQHALCGLKHRGCVLRAHVDRPRDAAYPPHQALVREFYGALDALEIADFEVHDAVAEGAHGTLLYGQRDLRAAAARQRQRDGAQRVHAEVVRAVR